MTFKKAVESATPPLNTAYQPGLQALSRKHSGKIQCTRETGATISGSIDIDAALKSTQPHASANRWDYGVGYRQTRSGESAIWVEVHGAVSDEVGTLVRKVTWLKNYLKQSAPALWQLTLKSPDTLRFVWLGTKSVHLPKNSPAYKRLNQAGITLAGTALRLP